VVDAIDEHEVYLIDDLVADKRWPPFRRRAAEETGQRGAGAVTASAPVDLSRL
jgi:hypothetical protein